MLKDEYSPYKMVHHQDKLDEMKRGEQPNPMQVHLIPTNRCNHNCTFCAYRIPEHSSNQNFLGNSQMPDDKLIEVIESCANMGVKAVQFTGGGEPLVHPNIQKAFETTLEKDMELALVSNGMALNDDLIDILSDVSWVRISVDAHDKSTYTMIRRVKSSGYDTVLNNISKLAERKKGTVLGVGFVVNRENFTEIYDACKLFKELGVDNFRISAAFTPQGVKYFDHIFEEAKELASRAKADFEDENYTVFNLFNDRIGDLFHGTQEYDYCPMKDLVPYIGADLKVYTCCILAYNDLGYIDSIENQTLEEMWAGKIKRDLFATHTPRKLCKLPCMFENKNKFINYCIKQDPRHTNFI